MNATVENRTLPTAVRIEEINPDQATLWDNFVEAHPDSTMYHLFGWQHVLKRTFGYKAYYLAAFSNGGNVIGVLPMFLMRDIFQRKYLVSNPFSNFAGLCTSDATAGQKLLERAQEIARLENAQYVELRQLRDPIEEEMMQVSLPTKETFVTLLLNLTPGKEAIWKDLSSRNRGKVRKGDRAGLKVDFGEEYLEDFHQILSVNLRYLGTPVHPISFYQALLETFPNRTDILVLKLESRVVAAMFLFKFKDVLAEPWVAALREFNRIYVNNSLYWKAIEFACDNNFNTFDFGRSTVDSGTFNFKTQWGAKPVQLYYHYYLNRAREIPVVDAHDNQYERYIEIWKKLPLSLTKIIGPKLVKYVPQL